MKAKVVRGSGFRGALNYVFDVKQTGKKAELIGGNMAGNNPRDLSREFSAIRKLKPDITKPVWHCSLSAPSGEKLSVDKWDTIANDFMQKMGFSHSTPWIAVRHSDTNYDHIHIVASRIGVDSRVWLGQWEARRAIEATQQLEKEHRLTLTPGLGDARAERRKLSGNEINMGLVAGIKPPRMQLQEMLDKAVESRPTALELAERLSAAGVGVRANIATTGKMSGFSFELDGIAFKASDLGKKYTWANLQKSGVTYVETRDREGLEQFRTAGKPSITGDDTSITSGNTGVPRGLEQATTSDYECYSTGNKPTPRLVPTTEGILDTDAGNDERDYSNTTENVRRTDRIPEKDAGKTSDRTDDSSRGDDRHESGKNGRRLKTNGRTESDSGTSAEREQRYKNNTGTSIFSDTTEKHSGSNTNNTSVWRRRVWRIGGKQVDKPTVKRSTPILQHADDQSDRRRTKNDFGNNGQTRIDTRPTREINPTAYLESAGYTVKRDGNRHLSARINGEEVYRITQKDGYWLWVDRYGNHGGDNIDLVKEIEPGIGFAQAVFRLSSASPIPSSTPTPPPPKPPTLPSSTDADRENGREYLKNIRLISLETITQAEKLGMLKYTGGGVLFVGYDQKGTPMNATRRAITAADPIQKRDLRGSDKSFPPVLPSNPSTVWIVEGGVDALALHDIAKRRNEQPPTVIVSGGANVRSFLERPSIQAILKRAERVIISGENEKDAKTQAIADDGHQRQAARVSEITGIAPGLWKPSPGIKDLADMNAREAAAHDAQHWQKTPAAKEPTPEPGTPRTPDRRGIGGM